MKIRVSLLQRLADGRFHSGEALGARLGISRAGVWKQVQRLKALGVAIHSVRGRGHRLLHPIELLSSENIQGRIGDRARALLSEIEVIPEVDSTNTLLKARATQGAPSGSVCLAEYQRAGRGRQGKGWVSPFGSNLYLSLLWRFSTGPAALAGLSLVVGVALARALEQCTGQPVGLKWPNDLLWQGRKLGGILIEVAGETSGPTYAIIGVGVNVQMPEGAGDEIGQPWTDISCLTGRPVSRNALSAAVLEQLAVALQTFETQGSAVFLDAWRDLDVTAGKAVELHLADRIIGGQARGIDESGALMIQVGGEIRRFSSGEVSLRMPT